MAVERIGSDKWQTRLRYGSGRRDRFTICAATREAAEAREARLIEMAKALTNCTGADPKALLAMAAEACTEAESAAAEAEALALAASVTRRPADRHAGATTFPGVTELGRPSSARKHLACDPCCFCAVAVGGAIHNAQGRHALDDVITALGRELAHKLAREVIKELPAALREEMASAGWLPKVEDDPEKEDPEVSAARAEMRKALGVE